MDLWFVIVLAVEGLVVGTLARLVVPGPDPMSVLGTFVLGLAGSFLAGVIAWVFIGHAAGIIFALLGATALVYVRHRFAAAAR
ncbi:MAG TPA: hypothetical protein VGH79_08115 [Gaiellaceae bacterium]